jgi:hypothetical protein
MDVGGSQEFSQVAMVGSDREKRAKAAIDALRAWLKSRGWSMPEVAKQIRLMDREPFETGVSCSAVERFLSLPEVQCRYVEDGRLDLIFQVLDPEGLGVLNLADLLGQFQPSRSQMHVDTTGSFGVSNLSADAAREEQSPAANDPVVIKEAMNLSFGQKDEDKLYCIFSDILPAGCDEVYVPLLVTKIRTNPEVQSLALLEHVISMVPGDRRTTLGQALDSVEASFKTISWERFRTFIREAPYSNTNRPMIPELMGGAFSPTEIVPPSATMPIISAGGNEDPKWDPNEQPELANDWMERSLGVNHDMLHSLFRMFIYFLKGRPVASPVRIKDFVCYLQMHDSLMKSFRNTGLCSPDILARTSNPRFWDDVVVHLNCHSSDSLTWADILEVIRWQCDVCFGRVGIADVGPGGYSCDRGRPGPAVPINAKSRDSLAKYMTGGEKTQPPESKLAAKLAVSEQVPVSPVRSPAVATAALLQSGVEQLPSRSAASNAEPASPVDIVGSLFEKALHPVQGLSAHQGGAFQDVAPPHPFKDYESEEEALGAAEPGGDTAAVARLLEEHWRRQGVHPRLAIPFESYGGASQLQQSSQHSFGRPGVVAMSHPRLRCDEEPSRSGGHHAALKISLAGQPGMSPEHLAAKLACILGLHSDCVQLKR